MEYFSFDLHVPTPTIMAKLYTNTFRPYKGYNQFYIWILLEYTVLHFDRSPIEHYLKACVGKPDCREMKMDWVISMSEQSGSPFNDWYFRCTIFTLVSLHIVTVSTDDHSLLDHLVWVTHNIHSGMCPDLHRIFLCTPVLQGFHKKHVFAWCHWATWFRCNYKADGFA